MSKSFCIKTNNKKVILYLLNTFKNTPIKNMYVSSLKHSKYNNIVIHYTGKNINSFNAFFNNAIANCIINLYEFKIIKHIINCNYFYFTEIEQQKILDITVNYLKTNELNECASRKSEIESSITEYFLNNKSVILDGFINFRINSYIKALDSTVDSAVNKFVIDREYLEFIDLLKCYINSKSYGTNTIHLVYNSQESFLLDEFKNNISLKESPLDNKFISDISFSSNDYTLNALLTLLPKKIYIHIIDKKDDEFINTLKLIFENRIIFCSDCNICRTYKLAITKRF